MNVVVLLSFFLVFYSVRVNWRLFHAPQTKVILSKPDMGWLELQRSKKPGIFTQDALGSLLWPSVDMRSNLITSGILRWFLAGIFLTLCSPKTHMSRTGCFVGSSSIKNTYNEFFKVRRILYEKVFKVAFFWQYQIFSVLSTRLQEECVNWRSSHVKWLKISFDIKNWNINVNWSQTWLRWIQHELI